MVLEGIKKDEDNKIYSSDIAHFIIEARRLILEDEFDTKEYTLVEILEKLWEQGEKAWKYDKLQKDKE